jgi:hypothetical protein
LNEQENKKIIEALDEALTIVEKRKTVADNPTHIHVFEHSPNGHLFVSRRIYSRRSRPYIDDSELTELRAKAEDMPHAFIGASAVRLIANRGWILDSTTLARPSRGSAPVICKCPVLQHFYCHHRACVVQDELVWKGDPHGALAKSGVKCRVLTPRSSRTAIIPLAMPVIPCHQLMAIFFVAVTVSVISMPRLPPLDRPARASMKSTPRHPISVARSSTGLQADGGRAGGWRVVTDRAHGSHCRGTTPLRRTSAGCARIGSRNTPRFGLCRGPTAATGVCGPHRRFLETTSR